MLCLLHILIVFMLHSEIKLSIIVLIILFGFNSCEPKNQKSNSNNKTKNIHVNIDLSDKNFPFKNISSSLIAKSFFYDKILFTDKSEKVSFTILDSLQKLKIIAPVIDIDPTYIATNMEAVFVSKQDKIGDYTPIIVLLSGDDYESLIYILVDKNNKPISHLILSGGNCAGPDEETDSTFKNCPDKTSFLNGNEILSYVLIICERKDSVSEPAIIDSITFKSIIKLTGQIETKRMDSVRYKRRVNFPPAN